MTLRLAVLIPCYNEHVAIPAVVAAFRDARVVPRLPKTRSGKILRASIRRLADGEQVAAPATIDDPAILDEIRAALGRTETS